MNWEIWIDTGGTFTDCVGIRQDGLTRRCKVLSSGEVRGQILSHGTDWVEVPDASTVLDELFIGYKWDQLKLIAIDQANHRLQFDGPVPAHEKIVRLTAGQQAPVLGARILTRTPLDQALPVSLMKLGTTKGTNALLENQGANTLLITNTGYKDFLAIGHQQRPDLFSLVVNKRPMLYQQALEVDVRCDHHGLIIKDWTSEELKRAVTAVEAIKPEAIAICLIHAVARPQLEHQLAERLTALGYTVTCSSDISNEIKMIPRGETAVTNAYLTPVLNDYLSEIKRDLHPATIKVMSSAGALTKVEQFSAKDSLLSGPAGGVLGSAYVGQLCQESKILTLDMGGTSTDVARYDGAPDYQYITRVGHAELATTSVAVETVAAGGGSICWFDGNSLQVGPQSAGAQPGPACYGAGGPLTVTDLNLLAGHTDPSQFSIPIDVTHAKAALQKLSNELHGAGIDPGSPETLLSGLLRIANERMAEAVRKISVSKGFDPSTYTLLAFGGAGAQHGCQVAELLGIRKVIVPADGSLLSAVGIGQAKASSIQRKAMNISLSELMPTLDQELMRLQQQGVEALTEQGIDQHKITRSKAAAFLRFKGQDNALEIPVGTLIEMRTRFRQDYEQLFGHWIDHLEIHVQTLQVDVVESIMELQLQQPEFDSNAKTGAIQWSEVSASVIAGPALVSHPFTTVHVPQGWTFQLFQGQGILTHNDHSNSKEDQVNAAVSYQLFANRFRAVADEMGAMLQRTSFSVNVKERMDFSCGLLDQTGRLVVNAPHIPVHLGSLGLCTRLVEQALNLQQGDIAITNHPAFGGSHLPDITLVAPVYFDGQRIGYVANRAHHAEIGGKTPGSMPADATRLTEEGVPIRPKLLASKGKVRWQELRDWLEQSEFPSRSVDENLADIQGALASIKNGEQGLIALCMEHGAERVKAEMNRIITYGQTATQRVISSWADGQYRATESMDDGHTIQLEVTVKGDHARFDFNGSSKQHPNNLNANRAIVQSALMYFMRILSKEDLPLNDGILQAVDLVLPTSFLNPEFDADDSHCPAVVGGNVEVSQRVVDTMIKAMEVGACSQGTMNNFLFGNQEFGYYETICGGTGAVKGRAGADGVHQHMTNTRITDPETLERRYPVRLDEFSIRPHSGGKGKWQGGNGVTRILTLLQPLTITWLTQHRKVAPYGLKGGAAGQCGSQVHIRGNQRNELPPSGNLEALAGDQFIMNTPGGGGYGTM